MGVEVLETAAHCRALLDGERAGYQAGAALATRLAEHTGQHEERAAVSAPVAV